MGSLGDLRGKTVGVDTSPSIFFIERHSSYVDLIRPFFKAVDRGDCSMVTSVITLLEVLVHPIRHGDARLADQYRKILLNSNNITTLGVTADVANRAAELRVAYRLKTPDAIQLASAVLGGAELFITGDEAFSKVSEIEVIRLQEITS